MQIKSEARNPKFEAILNVQNSNGPKQECNSDPLALLSVLTFGHSDFEFVSNFDIRISNLWILPDWNNT
ncbi:MAG: hypothetical protein CVU64_14975 [Deltaproteobacteria bacterium HGW-Deltaproteobacteria-21]|nr:MAG: hypothetical protein CVU64_14975 [Deltaproteobacteria bacterium HGW-Deltaproteobacteria-21]